MSSRAFLLICLSLAFATLIVSEVAVARELAETSAEALDNEVDSANGVKESKYPGGDYGGPVGYGGNPGGGYGGYGGYGGRGGYGGGGGYGRDGRCRYGCCGRGRYGCRCCSYAGNGVKESKYPGDDYGGPIGYGGNPGGGYGGRGGNGGGGGYGGGGRCRYGCCGSGVYGCRCCSYAGEAADAEPQTQP